MIVKRNGERYEYTRMYDQPLHEPYDYENDGLMSRIVSKRLSSTKNEITRFILNVFEKEIVFLLKYADILANFKNPFYRNR